MIQTLSQAFDRAAGAVSRPHEAINAIQTSYRSSHPCSSISGRRRGRRSSEAGAGHRAEEGHGIFEWTTKPEERNRLWNGAHEAYFAVC